MKEIIKLLSERNETLSTMESCTGGGLANAITNTEGASLVFHFGGVTYSNEYKMKLGVSKEVIDKYSVYSMECAKEMSSSIANYTSSTYGIGITGKLMRNDINNPYGKDNIVYVSVYDRINDKYYNEEVEITCEKREDSKMVVIGKIVEILLGILKERV